MSLIHDSLRRQQPSSGKGPEHRRALGAEQVLAPLGYVRAVPLPRRGTRALIVVGLGLLAVLAAWAYLTPPTPGAVDSPPARTDLSVPPTRPEAVANSASAPAPAAAEAPVAVVQATPPEGGTGEPPTEKAAAEPTAGSATVDFQERRPPGDIFLPREEPAPTRAAATAAAVPQPAPPAVAGSANEAAPLTTARPASGQAAPAAEAPVAVAQATPPEGATEEPPTEKAAAEPTAGSATVDFQERRPPGDIFLPREKPAATERASLDGASAAPAKPEASRSPDDRTALALPPDDHVSTGNVAVADTRAAPGPAPVDETAVTPKSRPSRPPGSEGGADDVLAEARSLPGDIHLPPEPRRVQATPAATTDSDAAVVTADAGGSAGIRAAEPVATARPRTSEPDGAVASVAGGGTPARGGVTSEGSSAHAPAPSFRPTYPADTPPRPSISPASRIALATSTSRSTTSFGTQPPTPPPPVYTDANAATPEADDFRAAVHAQRAGDMDSALGHYRAVLERNDRDAEAHNNLGVLLQQRDRLEEAQRSFERAIAIDPGHVKAHNNLGVVSLRLGRPDQAAMQFRTALESDPRNVDAMVNLAIALRAGGKRSESREILLHAVETDGANPAAHYNLALLYDETGDPSKAVGHYRQFLRYGTIDHVTLAADVRRRIDVLAAGTR